VSRLRIGRIISDCLVGPNQPYSLFAGFIHLAAGSACGFTGLAAGYAIGIVGDAVSLLIGRKSEADDQCVRAYLNESRIFVAMVLILIFA
jgi:V-type H+-transporting ATPase proteolipid subunit